MKAYLRCIHLMPDKAIFSVKDLDIHAFAISLGLDQTPEGLEEAFRGTLENNALKKQKNTSSLQRLKDKIRQRKAEKEAAKRGETLPTNGTEEGKPKPVSSDEDSEDEPAQKKKLTKRERRLKKIEMVRQLPTKEEEVELEEDKVMISKGQPDEAEGDERDLSHLFLTKHKALRKQRLRFRKDGVAAVRGLGGALGHHRLFDDETGEDTSEFGLVSKELAADDEDNDDLAREAFVLRMKRKLEERSEHAKELWKERQRTKRLKRKERELMEKQMAKGGSDDDGEDGVMLGSAEEGSGSDQFDGGASGAEESGGYSGGEQESAAEEGPEGGTVEDLEAQALAALGAL
mmetsp:Transcript_6020/g.12632  ORF Transcript_6020/g.12632 Transcript_6020/m.12632 type:complete len:346 (-) Transcript_6020:74-1111(-)